MIRFFRWLIGFVDFTFSGGFVSGFINDCRECGFNISDVREKDGVLFASCPAKHYPYLRSAAKKNGGKIRIMKKRGLVFRLLPLRKRYGIFIGALFAVIIICMLSNFVWCVEISPCESVPAAEVQRLLDENGLREGAYKRSVDKRRIENLILAAFPDCAWVHINEKGTTMRVEIGEGKLRPETVNPNEYSNLVATKDGVIVKAVAYRGWAVKRKGEAVCEGDILVSGVYESEKKKMNLFAHADGEYIAEVKEPVKIKISRTAYKKVILGENRYKFLSVFGVKAPLFFSRVSEGDETEETQSLYLNGVRLPLGITTRTVVPYRVVTEELSDNELCALAEKEIEKRLETDFSGCDIIKKKLETSLNPDSITVTGYIICLENIGETVKIIP